MPMSLFKPVGDRTPELCELPTRLAKALQKLEAEEGVSRIIMRDAHLFGADDRPDPMSDGPPESQAPSSSSRPTRRIRRPA